MTDIVFRTHFTSPFFTLVQALIRVARLATTRLSRCIPHADNRFMSAIIHGNAGNSVVDSPWLDAPPPTCHREEDLSKLTLLWQPPAPSSLDRLSRLSEGQPVLIARFDTENACRQAFETYLTPSDFVSAREQIELQRIMLDARRNLFERGVPCYEGMPLMDGDLARLNRRLEMMTTLLALLRIRRIAPRGRIRSDWMGCRLAGSVDIPANSMPMANLRDPNWPPRRTLREWWSKKNSQPRITPSSPAVGTPVDLVFLIGGWVDERLLDVFPLRAAQRLNLRCEIWAHRVPPELEDLATRMEFRVRPMPYPPPARDVQSIVRRLHKEGARGALHEGYAPFRGSAARALHRLLAWERWAPKLIAMHRMLTQWLRAVRPRAVVLPAEKDWSAYVGVHAARRLGIPTMSVAHGSWLPHTKLDTVSDDHLMRRMADRYRVFTPAERQALTSPDTDVNRYRWCGLPRTPDVQPGKRPVNESSPRLLVGTMGMGPGLPCNMIQPVHRWNHRLVTKLIKCFGERISIRLHPWDKPGFYPAEVRAQVRSRQETLSEQLATHDALITLHSTVMLDAAAAGLPVFLWDVAAFDLHRSELVDQGAAVCTRHLNELVSFLERYMSDGCYRAERTRAAEDFAGRLRADPAGVEASEIEPVDTVILDLLSKNGTDRDRAFT